MKRLTDTDMYTIKRFTGKTAVERRAAWLENRSHGVGGSDMSTILGLNQYATPLDLWLEKTGRREPEDISDKWAVVKGNVLENGLRNRFKRLHPEFQVQDGTGMSFISKQHDYLRASLDGIIWDKNTKTYGVLEIKTANSYRGEKDWHDENGNLKIPEYYLAQVTLYLAVTGWAWGYVYADIGETEPVEIRFERDEQDVEAVVGEASDFWQFVTSGTMPYLVGSDVAKVWPQDDGDVAEADPDTPFDLLAEQYKEAAEVESNARKHKDEIGDKLKLMVREHKSIVGDRYRVSYVSQHRDAYEVAATDFRKLTVAKIKGKKEQ